MLGELFIIYNKSYTLIVDKCLIKIQKHSLRIVLVAKQSVFIPLFRQFQNSKFVVDNKQK